MNCLNQKKKKLFKEVFKILGMPCALGVTLTPLSLCLAWPKGLAVRPHTENSLHGRCGKCPHCCSGEGKVGDVSLSPLTQGTELNLGLPSLRFSIPGGSCTRFHPSLLLCADAVQGAAACPERAPEPQPGHVGKARLLRATWHPQGTNLNESNQLKY